MCTKLAASQFKLVWCGSEHLPTCQAAPIPGALKPHIACPTTAGTGSEGTGYAICDITALGVKTALANRYRTQIASNVYIEQEGCVN